MPKVMVLFFGDESSAAIVEAVVAGAKSVRFTEVEVRAASGDASATKYPRIDPERPAGEADGVVLVAGGAGSTSAATAQVIDHLAHAPGVQDLVLGVAAEASVVDRVARTGGIVIVSRSRESGAATVDAAFNEARALGVRVAKVAGWVRHGLGHEAEHERGSHDHAHQGHDHHHHEHGDHAHHDDHHRDHQH